MSAQDTLVKVLTLRKGKARFNLKKRWIVLIIILILIVACVTCFLVRTPDFLGNLFPADAGIKTGSYLRIQPNSFHPMPVAVTLVRLDIDRKKGQAVFHFQDGSTVQAALAGPDQRQWLKGCPSMIGTTRMEFLPLAQDRLVLGETSFEKPYLEGTCPASPLIIVLGENKRNFGDIQDAAACDWYLGAKCVYFEQR